MFKNLFIEKQKGFTLAEVLITLGIIGVVAAMTMPVLMNNFKKKTYEAQFLKTINYIVNANKKLLQEEEIDDLCNTDYFTCSGPYDAPKIASEKIDEYASRIKLEKRDSNWSWFSMSGDKFYVSNFGACFYEFNNLTEDGLGIIVDTNCQKAPNIGGRDVFWLFMNKSGNIVSFNNTPGSVWDADSTNSTCEEAIKEEDGEGYAAMFCAQRLIINNYKMDY